jgi:hypothetical protein
MAETNHKKTSQQKRQCWQTHNEACRKSGLTRAAGGYRFVRQEHNVWAGECNAEVDLWGGEIKRD